MTERPIIFSCDMVRAILRGEKTQTRRPVKPPFMINRLNGFLERPDGNRGRLKSYPCPFGQPGDRLWVKETFAYEADFGVAYRADEGDNPEDVGGKRQKWTPSIHMPRGLSRITLEITDINAERVQDISEKDAWAEGMEALDGSFNEAALCATAKRYEHCVEDSRCIYAHLWNALYAKRPGLSWEENPWVWAITFKLLESSHEN